MPGRQRDEQARVLGPQYISSRKHTPWRLVIVHNPAAERKSDRSSVAHYPTEASANEAKREIEARIINRTVSELIDAYEQHLIDKDTIGYEETIRRLRLFFDKVQDMMVGRLTADKARELYDAFRGRTLADGVTPISVAYHRAVLINARSMFKFAKAKKWVPENPFKDTEGIGKRKSGKRKPSGNELQKWYGYVMKRIEEGHDPALALMLDLALALRSGDICRRIVRDVDMGGTQLLVYDGKSENSDEPREIPVELQPFVQALIANRNPLEPLFKTSRTETGFHDHHWLWQAQERFCRLSGVPHFPPHSLKGVAGTILAKRGAAGKIVMEELSHGDQRTTRRHYVAGSVIDAAQAREAFKVVSGGRK